MATQELLEVQNRQVVRLAEGEELAESGVGLDGLLVHQVVGLGIGHDTLGDRRAANLRSLRLAEERAELVRNLDGLREDAGLRLRTLDLRAGALAAAVRTLGEASSLLLNRLEGRGSRGRRGLEVVQVLLQRRNGLLQRGTEVLIRRRGWRRGNNGLRDWRGDHRGSHLSLGRLLGGLGGNRGGRRHRGSNSGSLGLGGLLGGLGGRAHRTRGGGCRCGHGTQ